MKYTLIILLQIASCLAMTGAKAQSYDSTGHYGDTTITLTLTQRAAVYIGFSVKNYNLSWQNRLMPSVLKPYVGSGTHLDSTFTVTLKASYITGMIDLLLTGQDEAVQADRLSIINNSPTVSGYTALATQVVSLANGSGSQKNVATYIVAYYNAEVAQLDALRAQVIAGVVQWTQQ